MRGICVACAQRGRALPRVQCVLSVCREVEVGRQAAHDCEALRDCRVRPEAMIWGRKASLKFLIFTLAAGEVGIHFYVPCVTTARCAGRAALLCWVHQSVAFCDVCVRGGA